MRKAILYVSLFLSMLCLSTKDFAAFPIRQGAPAAPPVVAEHSPIIAKAPEHASIEHLNFFQKVRMARALSQQGQYHEHHHGRRDHTLSLASFLLAIGSAAIELLALLFGIVGIPFAAFFLLALGFLCGLAAIVVGIMALANLSAKPGFALGGIILGACMLAITFGLGILIAFIV